MTAVVLVLVGALIGGIVTNAVWRHRAEDHNWRVTWLQEMHVKGISSRSDHDWRFACRVLDAATESGVEILPDVEIPDDVLPPSAAVVSGGAG